MTTQLPKGWEDRLKEEFVQDHGVIEEINPYKIIEFIKKVEEEAYNRGHKLGAEINIPVKGRLAQARLEERARIKEIIKGYGATSENLTLEGTNYILSLLDNKEEKI